VFRWDDAPGYSLAAGGTVGGVAVPENPWWQRASPGVWQTRGAGRQRRGWTGMAHEVCRGQEPPLAAKHRPG
jgi:hypothetical protein